jgi:hypothetical protein
VAVWCVPARAAGCPNEGVREKEVHGLALPDCRAYEQVSPVKAGIDAQGFPGSVQSSTSGGRVRYWSVTPFPFPELCALPGSKPEYVSSRGAEGGWATEGILPCEATAGGKLGFSEDLTEALVWTEGVALTPGAPLTGRSYYLRYSEPPPGAERYRLLVRTSGSGTQEDSDIYLAGFSSDDQHLAFESKEHLLSGATEGVPNAYEVDLAKPVSEQLSLVGVLPASEGGKAPPGGSVVGAGAYAWPMLASPRTHYTQSAISRDGSRVFFTALPSERVYVRENASQPQSPIGAHEECTDPVDACTLPVSQGTAHFRDATPEGTYAIYTEAGALYRYNLETGAHETLAPESVLGVLGASREGQAVYFAAGGVLAANANSQGETAASEPRTADLYESYQPPTGAPHTIFIARLINAGLEGEGDEEDWNDYLDTSFSAVQKTSRVTPDGKTLLFASRRSLTGYNNSGPCGGIVTSACSELYRYQAGPEGAPGRLTCVSCNPDRATPPSEDTLLAGSGSGLTETFEAVMTRNLSENGERVFFQSPDALVADDTNGQTNVYEWEADGEGSCTSETQNEGCLYLISSGTGEQSFSYFGDASPSGNDVFFFTRQALTPTEAGVNVNVYDARVCTKGDHTCEKQSPVKPAECSEECANPYQPPPPPPSPASSQLTGNGNLDPPNPTQPTTKPPPTHSQTLAAALKACRAKHNKHKRHTCETQAHKHHPTTK